MRDSRPFSHWVFDELVSHGAIKDYERNPHVGRGRKPKGTLSISLPRLVELKASSDHNDILWGLIGSAMTKKHIPKEEFKAYAKQHASTVKDFVDIMIRAVAGAKKEFAARYKEIPEAKETLEAQEPQKAQVEAQVAPEPQEETPPSAPPTLPVPTQPVTASQPQGFDI